MDNHYLTLMIILTVTLAVGVAIARHLATSAVGRELRNQLEREGWGSLQELGLLAHGSSGFRGTWQGREAVARYHKATKTTFPSIEIEVATPQFEPIRISRRYPSGRLAFLDVELDLPPRVKLMDERFDAHCRSAETIYEILRDEATASQLNRLFRFAEDRIDSNRGTLQARRTLWDGPKPRFAVILRPAAGELERSVSLAHRIFESLAERGF